MLDYEGDGQDQYRAEYNDLLTDKAADSNNLIQEKYITISAEKKNIEEARTFFNRVHTDLTNGLARLDSAIREVNINERLRLFHDFFRPGEEQIFHFDLAETMRRGHDFKDAIAPDCLSFKKNYYEMGDVFGRVLFLRDYGSFITDDLITSLMDFPRNMMLSIDIIPMGMDDAIKMVDKVIMSVESDATRIQQRQMSKNLYLAKLPYQVEQMQKVSKEYMDDLTEHDQRIMFGLVTLTHLADSVEQLDQDTESLKSRTGNCEFATLKYQQEDGLNTVLPYGLRRIDATRTLTTESTAVLMPFRSQEIQHTGGIYYGVNAVSHNLNASNRIVWGGTMDNIRARGVSPPGADNLAAPAVRNPVGIAAAGVFIRAGRHVRVAAGIMTGVARHGPVQRPIVLGHERGGEEEAPGVLVDTADAAEMRRLILR